MKGRLYNPIKNSTKRKVLSCHCIFAYFIAVTCAIVNVSAQNDGLDGKDLPEKGDKKCPSLAERYSNYKDGGDASIWSNPCDEELDLKEEYGDGPVNRIALQLFAALPAYSRDFRSLISWAVVGFLDEASIQYHVTYNDTMSLDFFNYYQYTDRRVNPTHDAEVVYQYVLSESIKTLDESWWYQYQLVFYCYYGNIHNEKSGSPILETEVLRTIQRSLNYYLRQGIALVNTFELYQMSYGVMGLSIEDPRRSTTPFKDGPQTMEPTSSPTYSPDSNSESDDVGPLVPTTSTHNRTNVNPGKYDESFPNPTFITYTEAIEIHIWDWRRYLGLGLFLFTMVGTAILTLLAALRRRQQIVKEIWGNLGSEQGVDALLSTGWKVKGSKMEVFKKEGIGYSDDDSMLLGGYEQTAYLGAEITVSQDDKSTTPPEASRQMNRG